MRRAYGALGLLARAVDIVTAVVAVVIAVGVLLVVLAANPSNEIVRHWLDAARWLVGPFKNFFSLHDHKLQVAVNWGLALVLYVALGRLLSSLLRRRR